MEANTWLDGDNTSSQTKIINWKLVKGNKTEGKKGWWSKPVGDGLEGDICPLLRAFVAVDVGGLVEADAVHEDRVVAAAVQDLQRDGKLGKVIMAKYNFFTSEPIRLAKLWATWVGPKESLGKRCVSYLTKSP